MDSEGQRVRDIKGCAAEASRTLRQTASCRSVQVWAGLKVSMDSESCKYLIVQPN